MEHEMARRALDLGLLGHRRLEKDRV